MEGARTKFDELELTLTAVVSGAQEKFKDNDERMEGIVKGAKEKLEDIEESVRRSTSSGGSSDPKKSKSSFLPDKMMVPQKFSDNIVVWRKWKEDVSKYFDEGKEEIKRVLDEVAKSDIVITLEVLESVHG